MVFPQPIPLVGEIARVIQYLRIYVYQLRQKIEADPDRPRYILTESGVGYRLKTS